MDQRRSDIAGKRRQEKESGRKEIWKSPHVGKITNNPSILSGERGYNGDGLDAWNTDLAYPGAMVITRHNLLYFVDTGNNLVRRVTAISTVEPPVKYTDYGKPESQPDERNFLQVLFGGGSKKATSKK